MYLNMCKCINLMSIIVEAGIEEQLVTLLGEYMLSGAEGGVRPVTYAGGVRSIEDLELVNRLGQGKVRFPLDVYNLLLNSIGKISFRNCVLG